jgi:hypothetical protein
VHYGECHADPLRISFQFECSKAGYLAFGATTRTGWGEPYKHSLGSINFHPNCNPSNRNTDPQLDYTLYEEGFTCSSACHLSSLQPA